MFTVFGRRSTLHVAFSRTSSGSNVFHIHLLRFSTGGVICEWSVSVCTTHFILWSVPTLTLEPLFRRVGCTGPSRRASKTSPTTTPWTCTSWRTGSPTWTRREWLLMLRVRCAMCCGFGVQWTRAPCLLRILFTNSQWIWTQLKACYFIKFYPRTPHHFKCRYWVTQTQRCLERRRSATKLFAEVMGRQLKSDRIQNVLLVNSYIREQNSVSGLQTSQKTLVRLWCACVRRRAGSGSKHSRTPKHAAH